MSRISHSESSVKRSDERSKGRTSTTAEAAETAADETRKPINLPRNHSRNPAFTRPAEAHNIASMNPEDFIDPVILDSAGLDLLHEVYHNEDHLRGKDGIKLYQAPIDITTIWLDIQQRTNLSMGVSFAACITYSLKLLSESEAYVAHEDVASDVRLVNGLEIKRRMLHIMGSMKRPMMVVGIPAIAGCSEKDNITFKVHEKVRESLYGYANRLGMSASNLATVCVCKGLADADRGLEVEFREWARELWTGFLGDIEQRTKEIWAVFAFYKTEKGRRKA